MIRVAHLIHTMAYGGIETGLLHWVRTMDASRFEVHLFCFANPGGTEAPFIEAAERQGFPVERIPWSRRKPVFRAARLMARHVRALGIDILHCHNTYAQLTALATGRLTGVRTITTLYLWGDFGWKRNVLQWADRLSAPFLDCISVHCERTFADSVERGLAADRLVRLPCGFDGSRAELTAEERRLRRAELGAAEGDTALIYVARFWPEKAHAGLLEGFRRIAERRGGVRLWLAGSGPEEERIRALADRLGLSDRVRFLGYRRDVPELLAAADLQVHPSDLEGVAQAVCEGMLAGLPIVATAVGGLTEVLHDGQTAVLVPPRRPDLLAEAVLLLMDDPVRARALGEAAHRFITQEYSLAASTARVEAVYEGMMAG